MGLELGRKEINLGGFILMTSFSDSSTISLLRDPHAIIVEEAGRQSYL
jgi:hypothetical protein